MNNPPPAGSRLGLDGFLQGVLDLPVIGGFSLSVSYLGQFVVFLYIWLPFMILPIVTALERVPRSYLEASADLGAKPATTFRRILWTLSSPASFRFPPPGLTTRWFGVAARNPDIREALSL